MQEPLLTTVSPNLSQHLQLPPARGAGSWQALCKPISSAGQHRRPGGTSGGTAAGARAFATTAGGPQEPLGRSVFAHEDAGHAHKEIVLAHL